MTVGTIPVVQNFVLDGAQPLPPAVTVSGAIANWNGEPVVANTGPFAFTESFQIGTGPADSQNTVVYQVGMTTTTGQLLGGDALALDVSYGANGMPSITDSFDVGGPTSSESANEITVNAEVTGTTETASGLDIDVNSLDFPNFSFQNPNDAYHRPIDYLPSTWEMESHASHLQSYESGPFEGL